jgi:hypothetical protein
MLIAPRAHRRCRRVAALCGMLAAPLAFTAQGTITTNDACAASSGGQCCEQRGAVCINNDKPTEDAYFTDMVGPCEAVT